jgi:hypothetical protein
MACGNNHVTRDYLTSQPTTAPDLREIHVRLPADAGAARIKADVWTTRHGTFQDQPGVSRARPGVTGSDERKTAKWDHVDDAGKKTKAYTHLTGRAGWLGPSAVLDRLPADARQALQQRQVIILGKSPNQLWMNERGTMSNSQGPQTTVVRFASQRRTKF